MPIPAHGSQEVLERLDSRHDELIRRLDELNTHIEAALAEFTASRQLAAAAPASVEQRKAA